MGKEIPIVCNLTDTQLRERRENYLDKLAASLIDCEELENGFSYRFPADETLLQNLVAAVALERKCCPFLNFKLILESGNDFVLLELTGAEGAKEMIESLFDWS